MHDEEAWLRAIQKSPGDAQLKLAYADWLEERGDRRAQFIRAVDRLAALSAMDPPPPEGEALAAQKEALRDDIDVAWQQAMGYWQEVRAVALVEFCAVVEGRTVIRGEEEERHAWEARAEGGETCIWNLLRPTESKDVRFCSLCQQHVYLREYNTPYLNTPKRKTAFRRSPRLGPSRYIRIDPEHFLRAEVYLETELVSPETAAMLTRYRRALALDEFGEALELLVQLGDRQDCTNPFWKALEPVATQVWPTEHVVDRRERGNRQARIDMIRRRGRGER